MSNESELQKVLTDFLHKLESLQESLPLLMIMALTAKNTLGARKAAFLQEKCTLIEEIDEVKKFNVPLEFIKHVHRLEKKENRAKTAYNVLPSKFLISFVSEYDAFLGGLIKCLFKIKPELLNASEKNISFSDLQELGSIEAAHEHVLEKEVEAIMRKSHSDQFKWLESSFNIPLTKGLDSWSSFIELTERRNLFVHCDGIVSSQYLTVCKRNGVNFNTDLQVGTKLDTPKAYLSDAYRCLYEIGVKLTHVLWRKLLPDNLEDSDNSLINISIELIRERDYELAKRLLDFSACTLKKWGSEANRRILIVNRAQTYYHSGDKATCNKILDAEDWSACGEQFKICHHVLKNKFDDALILMKRMGKHGPVSEASYLDWPVFRELREQGEFSAIYREIFGRDPVNISETLSSNTKEEKLNTPPLSIGLDEVDEFEKLASEHTY